MILIYTLLFQSLFSLIKLKENLKIEDIEIKKDSTLIILETKLETWYEIFDAKKSIGFASSACASVDLTGLVLKKSCILYSNPSVSSNPKSLIDEEKVYKIYLVKNIPVLYVAYKDKKFYLNYTSVYIDPEQQKNLVKIPIENVVKMNKDKIYISSSFDKTMYFTSSQGLFMSYNGKDWYFNSTLDKKKYEIAITEKGWIIADNLYSTDYGINFSEIFPKYAFPVKDAYVKNILASPTAKSDLYLTFSSKKDSSQMILYVLNTEKIEEGWKRVYPNIDGSLQIVKVDDSFTSIVNFISNYLIKQKKIYEIQDVNIKENENSWDASLLLTSKKDKYIVNMNLVYNLSKSWQILKETWIKI